MDRLYRELNGKPFEILAIDVGETREEALTFVKRLNTTFPVLLDRKGEVFEQWKVYVYPTNFIVDKKGQIRYGSPGAIDWDEKIHRHTILKLLDE